MTKVEIDGLLVKAVTHKLTRHNFRVGERVQVDITSIAGHLRGKEGVITWLTGLTTFAHVVFDDQTQSTLSVDHLVPL